MQRLTRATIPLASIWEVRTQGIGWPPRLETQTNIGNYGFPGQRDSLVRLIERPTAGKKARPGKAELWLTSGWRLGVDSSENLNPRETQPQGSPTILWDLPPGPWPDSRNKPGRKISLCFWKGKNHFINTPEISVVLKRPALREPVNQNLACWNITGAHVTWVGQKSALVRSSLPRGRRGLLNSSSRKSSSPT